MTWGIQAISHLPNYVKLERELSRLLEAGVQGNVFPGATAAITWRRGGAGKSLVAAAGQLGEECEPVKTDSLFDLASITKPVVAMTALRMEEAGRIDLRAEAAMCLPDIRGSCLGNVSIAALLEHRGGIGTWGGLYLDAPTPHGSAGARRWIIGEAARRPADEPGPLYSDLGYILAGEALARQTSTSLDMAVRRWVTEPLGIAKGLFFAGEPSKRSRLRRAAASEYCTWRGRIVRGEPHDENCAALGGVAGHAGLFGEAESLASFGLTMLDVLSGQSDFLSEDTLRSALRPRGDNCPLRFGWDTVSETSSAGCHVSSESFGHLGFTGTSIWCDPSRHVCVVLLTNRVHPSRANERIRCFRPAFHDSVFRTFDKVVGS